MSYHLSFIRSKDGQVEKLDRDEIRKLISKSAAYVDTVDDGDGLVYKLKTPTGLTYCLYFTNGHLWAERFDPEQIGELIKVAKELNCRLRGDEGETYLSAKETYIHPDDGLATEEYEKSGLQIFFRRRFAASRIFSIYNWLSAYITDFLTSRKRADDDSRM